MTSAQFVTYISEIIAVVHCDILTFWKYSQFPNQHKFFKHQYHCLLKDGINRSNLLKNKIKVCVWMQLEPPTSVLVDILCFILRCVVFELLVEIFWCILLLVFKIFVGIFLCEILSQSCKLMSNKKLHWKIKELKKNFLHWKKAS